MINNKDIKNIQDESRNILEKFGSSLSRVHEVIKKEENREQFREEMRGQDCDDDFKKRFFDNAPKHNDECIIAEKGHWN